MTDQAALRRHLILRQDTSDGGSSGTNDDGKDDHGGEDGPGTSDGDDPPSMQ